MPLCHQCLAMFEKKEVLNAHIAVVHEPPNMNDEEMIDICKNLLRNNPPRRPGKLTLGYVEFYQTPPAEAPVKSSLPPLLCVRRPLSFEPSEEEQEKFVSVYRIVHPPVIQPRLLLPPIILPRVIHPLRDRAVMSTPPPPAPPPPVEPSPSPDMTELIEALKPQKPTRLVEPIPSGRYCRPCREFINTWGNCCYVTNVYADVRCERTCDSCQNIFHFFERCRECFEQLSRTEREYFYNNKERPLCANCEKN